MTHRLTPGVPTGLPWRGMLALVQIVLVFGLLGCVSGRSTDEAPGEVALGPTWTIQVSGTVVGPHGAPYSGGLHIALRQSVDGAIMPHAYAAAWAREGRFQCRLRAPGLRHDQDAVMRVETYTLEPEIGIYPFLEPAYSPHLQVPPPLKLTEATLVPPNTKAHGESVVRVETTGTMGRAVCDLGEMQLDVANPFGTLTIVGGPEGENVLLVFNEWSATAPQQLRSGAGVWVPQDTTIHLHGWTEQDELIGTVPPIAGYGLHEFRVHRGEDALILLRPVRTVNVVLDPALAKGDVFVALTSVDGTREIECRQRPNNSFGGRKPNPRWAFPCVEVGDYDLVVRRGSREYPGEVLRTELVLVVPGEDVHLDVK